MTNKQSIAWLLLTTVLVGCGSKDSSSSSSLEDNVQKEKKDVSAAESALEKERRELAQAELAAQQDRLKKDREEFGKIQAVTPADQSFKEKIDPLINTFTTALQKAIADVGVNIAPSAFIFNESYDVVETNIAEIDKVLRGKTEVINELQAQLSDIQRVIDSESISPDMKVKYQQLLINFRSEYVQYTQKIDGLTQGKTSLGKAKASLLQDLEDKLTPRAGGYGLNQSLARAVTYSEIKRFQIFHVKPEDQPRLLELFQGFLQKSTTKDLVVQGNKQAVVDGLLNVFKGDAIQLSSFKPKEKFTVHQRAGDFGEYKNPVTMNGAGYLDFQYIRETPLEIAPGATINLMQTAQGFIELVDNNTQYKINFFDGSEKRVPVTDWAPGRMYLGMIQKGDYIETGSRCLINKNAPELLLSSPFMEPVSIYNPDGTLTVYGKALQNILNKTLKNDMVLKNFWLPEAPASSLAADITPSTLGRSARQGVTGVDASHLYMNGVPAGKVEMPLPISINLKGKIDGAKSTAGMSGVVAYKVGNTVLGIVHAYANKGEGFESNSHQSETSVAISQSIGNAFIEGQVGYVGMQQVHNVDLTGTRFYLSVGFDTQYVSPFVQVAYRDFGAVNKTAAYVGAEVNIDSLKADTYSFDMSLNTKAGYDSRKEFTGVVEWSASLDLNSGISFKTDLTFGTNDGSSVGLTANLTR